MTNIPSLSWLADLNVYAVNRLPAHSDHVYYETMEDAENFNDMQMRLMLIDAGIDTDSYWELLNETLAKN